MSALAESLNGISVCVLGVPAFLHGRTLGILNRRTARHDAEMTQMWAAHARLAEEVARLAEWLETGADPELSAGLDRVQRGMDRLLTDLQAMDAQITEMEDAPDRSRGVRRNIENPEGADPS